MAKKETTKVVILTINTYRDGASYAVYSNKEQAELVAKINEEGMESVTEDEFKFLKSFAKDVTEDTLEDWVDAGEIDNLGSLNKRWFWTFGELNNFLKKNNYKIDEEIECMAI